MLKLIKCDKFVNQSIIIFNNGLNCILGDDNGSNSIGKSTSLLVIDYVFGGDKYAENREIRDNVGDHRIEFTYSFNGIDYSFHRDFLDKKQVFSYNENKFIKIEEFRDWLSKMYDLSVLSMTFRDAVGVYSRIYGKSTINEKQPLQSFEKESAEPSILRLIKLFGKYSLISEAEFKVKDAKDKFESFKKAQKYSFISSINAKTYSGNLIKINELSKQSEELTTKSDNNLLDLDSFQLEQTKELESEKSKLLRQRAIEKASLSKLEGNLSEINTISKIDEKDLISFFPSINMKKLKDIQVFHSVLRKNLKNEISNFISEKEMVISVLEEQINEIALKITEITNNKKTLSKVVIGKLIELQREIENLQKQNKEYEQLKSLKDEENECKVEYENLFMDIVNELEHSINTILEQVSDEINIDKKAPSIHFKAKNSYIFETDDDNGTGTNFKNLISFDLAILKLTKLPFLVHDSVMFKHIENNAIENILTIYNNSPKQIFIAFDKLSSYSNETARIINQNKVMSLTSNGGELFGFCWNKK